MSNSDNRDVVLLKYCKNKGCDEGEYKGEYQNGKRHGEGVVIYQNGDKHFGSWKDGKRHGEGNINYNDGTQFKGFWKDDKRSGDGVYIISTPPWKAKDIYNFTFKNDEIIGKCRVNYKEGHFYHGEWKDGKRHGHGKEYISWREQRPNKIETELQSFCYIGEWKDGKRHGYGTQTNIREGQSWFNHTYTGEWKDGKEHGKGSSTGIGGDREGFWENGKFKGEE